MHSKSNRFSQYAMTKVHSYKSGSSFGELALRNDKPRAATIITTAECHFATLSRTDFNKCLAKFDQRLFTHLLNFLHELPFFAHWSKSQLKKLIPSLNTVHAIRGQILVSQGEQNPDVYFIRSGELSG
jgi:CRP-like cAMP-binding protein